MKLVIFGLAVSSSWGNGHATLWRGLARALSSRGHEVIFFERNQPYYAANRDRAEIDGMELVIYSDWNEARARARREADEADVVMVTSFCPDGPGACDLALSSSARLSVYYDLDTPVTLFQLEKGEWVPYLPTYGLASFDLVLSYTGGRALDKLRALLGARRVAPLYGSVDPLQHHPAEERPEFAADLSYLGTYAADRQDALAALFLAAADARPDRTFLIGGAQYPVDFPWRPNIKFVRHVPPGDHPAFYASSPLTLNVTRAPMAALGHCPSARFFEAAACGAPVLSDVWEGIDTFFTPGQELLLARDHHDTLGALALGPEALHRIGLRARERALAEHTADHRAAELERLLEGRGGATPFGHDEATAVGTDEPTSVVPSKSVEVS